MLLGAPEAPPDRGNGLVGGDEHEVGGHETAGGVVLVVEEGEQAAGGGWRHVPEQFVAVLPLQFPQGIDRLVGLHPCHEAGGLLGRGLLQQGIELAGLHLLESIGGGLGLEDREQLPPGAAAEVFEKVCHLTGTEAAQPVVGSAELDVAGRSRRRAERLDRRPVDDLVRRRPGPPPCRAEPAQEGLRADVDADEAQRVVDGGEVEVGRAHHLDTVNIDELVVEHVTDQGHLALPPVEVPKIDAG